MESQGGNLDTEMVLVLGTSGMLLLTTAIAIFIYLYQRKLIKRKLEYQKIEDLLHQQELKSAYAMLAGQEKAHKRIAEANAVHVGIPRDTCIRLQASQVKNRRVQVVRRNVGIALRTLPHVGVAHPAYEERLADAPFI